MRLLDLSSNLIDEFPIIVKDIPKLEILRLIFNKITEIPANFFTADAMKKGLQELNMNSNPLTELPLGIQNLEMLKVIGMSCTQITEIPKVVAQLDNLEHLYCFGAPLTKPKSIIANKGF